MADPSESQFFETSEKDSHQEDADSLKYPQIHLKTSFDSLLKNSYASHSLSSTLAMTRTNGPSGQNGLSESWASISDAELSQNDELLSEQTDVESLVDIRREDDILSTQEEDESLDEKERCASQESPDALVPRTHTDTPLVQQSLIESSLLANHITLDEPIIPLQSDSVFVRHALKVFEPEGAAAFAPCLQTSEIVGTIDLTLNRLSLKDSGRESLRLLLLGNDYLPSLRDSIVTKVADALVTSGLAFSDSQISSPSRYHVVPDCFGPGSMPSAAELIPVGCQLEVDRYNDIRFSDGVLVLSEETTGKTLVCKDESLLLSQDLAIIVFSKNDFRDGMDTVRLFVELTKKNSLPCIVITVDDGWDLGTPMFSSGMAGVHRAISRRPVWDGSVLHRLPLDLDTFLNLNAAQLSRHLSWLIEHTELGDHRVDSENGLPKYGVVVDVLHDAGIQVRRTLSRVTPVFWIFLLVLLAMQSMTTFWSRQYIVPQTTKNTADVLPSRSVLDATAISTTCTSIVVASISPPAPVPLTLDATKSSSGTFEVEVIGSSHLVVRTPQKAKGKAPLKVVISREGQLIPADIKLLFPCVYSVHVPSEQLYGDISVRLEMPNPRLVDTIKLNLGTQTMDAWLKQTLQNAEHNLQSKLSDFQQALQGLDLPELRQRITEHANLVISGFSEIIGFEHRVQEPMRKLERLRLEFNERVDAMGEDYSGKLSRWLDQCRTKHQHLSKTAGNFVRDRFSSLRLQLPSLEAARRGFGLGQHLRNASHHLREGRRSERLAAAQGRAHHIVHDWRHKKEKHSRRRGH